MSDATNPLVPAALARLVGGDPLAAVLLDAAARHHPTSFAVHAALAATGAGDAGTMARARALAATRRERQHLAVIEAWQGDDHERGRLLAREHLAEFPDDLVISWLVGRR